VTLRHCVKSRTRKTRGRKDWKPQNPLESEKNNLLDEFQHQRAYPHHRPDIRGTKRGYQNLKHRRLDFLDVQESIKTNPARRAVFEQPFVKSFDGWCGERGATSHFNFRFDPKVSGPSNRWDATRTIGRKSRLSQRVDCVFIDPKRWRPEIIDSPGNTLDHILCPLQLRYLFIKIHQVKSTIREMAISVTPRSHACDQAPVLPHPAPFSTILPVK
jgi:hypothetical protein